MKLLHTITRKIENILHVLWIWGEKTSREDVENASWLIVATYDNTWEESRHWKVLVSLQVEFRGDQVRSDFSWFKN